MRIVGPDLLIIRVIVRKKAKDSFKESRMWLLLSRGNRRILIGRSQVRAELSPLSSATNKYDVMRHHECHSSKTKCFKCEKMGHKASK